MTLNVLSNNDRDQRTEYKTILRAHTNMLKDPVAVERGQRGGLRSQENRRMLVEEVKKSRFDELLRNLREMIDTGVISEILGNLRETDV